MTYNYHILWSIVLNNWYKLKKFGLKYNYLIKKNYKINFNYKLFNKV